MAPHSSSGRATGSTTSAPGSQRRTKGKEAAEELGVLCPEYMKIIKHFPPHLTWRTLLLLGGGGGMLVGDQPQMLSPP